VKGISELPCRDRRGQWYLYEIVSGRGQYANEELSLTNVNVRLSALKGTSQPTSSYFVVAKDMLNGVEGARAQQRSLAGAQEKVCGSGDARHDDCPELERQTKRDKTKHDAKEEMEPD
jgi:hypothetical protein